jgi:hypothetical protein
VTALQALAPAVLALLAAGCGLATRVRPVPRGALAAELSIGGPAVIQGAPIPLPLATAGAGYGVLDGLDVSVHLHLTPLANAKLFGLDVGLSGLVLRPAGWRPAIALGGRAYFFTDFTGGTLPYFDATAAVSWDAGRFRPYLMIAGQYAAASRAFGWALGMGSELQLKRTTVQLELRWWDPSRDVRWAAVEYLSPFKHGALGLQLSGRYDFFLFSPPPSCSPAGAC